MYTQDSLIQVKQNLVLVHISEWKVHCAAQITMFAAYLKIVELLLRPLIDEQ